MRQFRSYFPYVFLVFAFSVSFAFGQAGVERDRSFEIELQVLVGSNDTAAGARIPPNLSALVRDIRTRFAFENYRLANTYFGRVGNTGTLEYKSISSLTGQDPAGDTPSFLEWSLGSVRVLEGAPVIQAQPFRFGARVPIRAVSGAPADTPVTVNYEPIGFNVQRVNFRENTPTLIGTLNLPKASGTLFLVLTARSVE